MTFILDPRLQADTLLVGNLGLSRLLLMNDSRYPWLVLVPRRPNLVEISDLAADDRRLLMDEISNCGLVLQRHSGAHKMNVGAIGNLVPQLHVHVVARFTHDEAWPHPVWGRGARVPYLGDAGLHRAQEIWTATGLV